MRNIRYFILSEAALYFFLLFEGAVKTISERPSLRSAICHLLKISPAEFICGIINSVVFILFIARFENKILDIPPVILCILYVYAILQTCLPFVTGGTELIPGGHKVAETGEYLEEFKSIVLTICLVGKVTLSAVLLYVLNTGRIFYYFITLRRLHEEEERNWKSLKPLMEVNSIHSEPFSILYESNLDGSYSASIPTLLKEKVGRGKTEKEARADLLRKLQ